MPASTRPCCSSPTSRRRSGCSSGRSSPIACRPICLFQFITIRCPTISCRPGSTTARTRITTTTIQATPSSSPTTMPTAPAACSSAKFLGKALQARGLHFTPHYTLALMGDRRRQQSLDAADCRRLPLRPVGRAALHPHAGAAARSRFHRQPAGRVGTGDAGAPHAHQRGCRRRGRGFLRGAGASENRAAGEAAGQPAHRQAGCALSVTPSRFGWFCCAEAPAP